jgi:hypothetical protein
MNVERIGQPHEQVEHRADVDGLRDLRLRPSRLAKSLYLLVGNAIRVLRQGADNDWGVASISPTRR